MKTTLQAHPMCGALGEAASVSVEIAGSKDRLRLTYTAVSRVAIKMPALRALQASRHDELWFHTCGEMFIQDPEAPGPYLEFNFSPAGDWASYAFDDTLRGMRSHRWPGSDETKAPAVSATIEQYADLDFPHRLVVDVTIPRLALGRCSRLYPTMVLETVAGISLWAIWHPVDRPHFHHPDNFRQTFEVP